MDIIHSKDFDMKNRLILLLLIGTIFSACTKVPIKQESAFIVLKTPTMKYADMGFISEFESQVNVDIYAAGQPLLSFEISRANVCMSLFKCLDKEHFNEKVLNVNYPPDVLENIFRAKPIFNKQGFKKTEEGFKQNIKKEGLYDISYSVVSGQRVFRDTINKILIKVREQ